MTAHVPGSPPARRRLAVGLEHQRGRGRWGALAVAAGEDLLEVADSDPSRPAVDRLRRQR